MGGAPISKKLLPTCLKSVFCLGAETEGQRTQSWVGPAERAAVLRKRGGIK